MVIGRLGQSCAVAGPADVKATASAAIILRIVVSSVGQSGMIPAALIAAAHFLISLSRKSRRYSGDRRSGPTTVVPFSKSLACTAGVVNVATVVSLSLRTIGAGVSLGRKKANHAPASKL